MLEKRRFICHASAIFAKSSTLVHDKRRKRASQIGGCCGPDQAQLFISPPRPHPRAWGNRGAEPPPADHLVNRPPGKGRHASDTVNSFPPYASSSSSSRRQSFF